MSEHEQPEINPGKTFEVVETPVRNGLIYEIYFSTEEEASKAVTDFWNACQTESSTTKGLRSGMLKPTRHQITSGDRTDPTKLIGSDLQTHPGKLLKVQFNGNTEALSNKGVEALKKLGFIK